MKKNKIFILTFFLLTLILVTSAMYVILQLSDMLWFSHTLSEIDDLEYYEIGKDIPAGEYYLEVENTFEKGVVEIVNDDSGKKSSIYSISFTSFITLEEGDYVSFYNVEVTDVNELESLTPDDGKYNDGTYRVGIDIPAGDYYVEKSALQQLGELSSVSYYQIKSDSTKDSEIVKEGDIDSFSFFTIEEGQYLELENVTIKPASEVEVVQSKNGVYEEGTYRVGIDIPAGEYTLTNVLEERQYAKFKHYKSKEDFRENIFIDLQVYEEMEVTLSEGEIIELEGLTLTAQQPTDN